jgi:hypothetical protein
MNPLAILLPLLCLAACKEQTATDSLTDKRDGKTYKIVKIGEQVAWRFQRNCTSLIDNTGE